MKTLKEKIGTGVAMTGFIGLFFVADRFWVQVLATGGAVALLLIGAALMGELNVKHIK